MRVFTPAIRQMIDKYGGQAVADIGWAIRFEVRQPDSEALRLLRELVEALDHEDSEWTGLEILVALQVTRTYLAALPPSDPPGKPEDA